MKIIVYHSGYGCETGCCGHTVEDSESEEAGTFHFDHPWEGNTEEEFKEFAENLVRQTYGEEHVKDLDWENCIITTSC